MSQQLALVLNSGSSSIKFQLVDPTSSGSDTPFLSGLVEQIGEPISRITVKHADEKHILEAHVEDHAEGLARAFKLMEQQGAGIHDLDIVAVGHRLVHGGTVFSEPVIIDDHVLEQARQLIPLAPLHNPANIQGIEVARELLPNVPHVAVFDTSFFYNMPDSAAYLPMNKEVAEKYNIRRYGFHGTSHQYVAGKVARFLGRREEELNQITLHLGNGASIAAVKEGKAIDTSMSLTPLAGLVMGTRTGDIDPGIVFHLYRVAGMSIDEIDDLFNRKSGVKGIAGVNDFRDLHTRIATGDKNAKLALDMYLRQLRRYIGAYMVELGHVDCITFTAGVGENDEIVRHAALRELEEFGIKIDQERNMASSSEPRVISTDDSTIKVLVVPTNEELAIARYATKLAREAEGGVQG